MEKIVAAIRKANDSVLDYEKLAEEILDIKWQLQFRLDKNEITFDDFQNANRELDTFVDNIDFVEILFNFLTLNCSCCVISCSKENNNLLFNSSLN